MQAGSREQSYLRPGTGQRIRLLDFSVHANAIYTPIFASIHIKASQLFIFARSIPPGSSVLGLHYDVSSSRVCCAKNEYQILIRLLMKTRLYVNETVEMIINNTCNVILFSILVYINLGIDL